jgi:hypothetical protein
MKTILSELNEAIRELRTSGFVEAANDLTNLFNNISNEAKSVKTYGYDPNMRFDNDPDTSRYDAGRDYMDNPEDYMTEEEKRKKLGPTKLSPGAFMGPEERVPSHRVEEFKSMKPKVPWKITKK